MINYLKHTRIDKLRWDDCISRSVNRQVYAFSWYLDVVCPGWDALVEDDYSTVFPLTHKRKWTVRYLAQPFFTQQLGIFSLNVITESQVREFISAIPRSFRLVEIHLNSMNKYAGSDEETTLRINHELNLAPAYSEITGLYAQNTRRNIRKAHDWELNLSRTNGVDDLVGLFRENFGSREGKLKDSDYATLKRLLLYCIDHHLGYILGATTKAGALTAGAFFLFDQSRVYFLFAGSSPEARDNGAMFFLIDRFIAEQAGKGLVLDFEGGNDPNLGRFYKSFGAVEVPYPSLKINRLPKVVERGLYFMRKR